jgi:hypothetical protein
MWALGVVEFSKFNKGGGKSTILSFRVIACDTFLQFLSGFLSLLKKFLRNMYCEILQVSWLNWNFLWKYELLSYSFRNSRNKNNICTFATTLRSAHLFHYSSGGMHSRTAIRLSIGFTKSRPPWQNRKSNNTVFLHLPYCHVHITWCQGWNTCCQKCPISVALWLDTLATCTGIPLLASSDMYSYVAIGHVLIEIFKHVLAVWNTVNKPLIY